MQNSIFQPEQLRFDAVRLTHGSIEREPLLLAPYCDLLLVLQPVGQNGCHNPVALQRVARVFQLKAEPTL